MRTKYLVVLLERFGIDPTSARGTGIRRACTSWFTDKDIEFDASKGYVYHFYNFVQVRAACAHTRAHTHTLHTQHNTTQHIHTHTQGSVPAVTEFAKFALQVLKCLPSTALVEARFSLTTMMKSKHRSLLDIKKLRGMMLMKDELPFESEQLNFVELWSRMKPWLAKQGLIKPIKSRRSAYKVAKARKQLHELHGVSSEYV